MSGDLEQRVAALEDHIERLEGALEAHAALLAARASISTLKATPPLGVPDSLEKWEHHAFVQAILQLEKHKPADAASPRAEGFELVERQIIEAIHWSLPQTD